MPNNLTRTPARYLLAVFGIAVCYAIVAKLSLSFALVQQNASPVWPASGIALAALLVLGMRVWPGVFAGALLINLHTNTYVAAALVISCGNTLGAVVAYYLVWKFTSTSYPFTRASEFFKFILGACLLATLISPSIGVSSLATAGVITWSQFWLVWSIWWSGDAVGVLLMTPLLLGWYCNRASDWNLKKTIEVLIVVVITALLTLSIYTNLIPDLFTALLIGLSLLPIFVWSAFRYNIQITTLLIFLVSIISVFGTAQGQGPITQHTATQTIILLQSMVAVTLVTFVALTIVIGEYQRTKSILRYAYDDLAKPDETDVIGDTENLTPDNQLLYRNTIWRALIENTSDNIMLLDTEVKVLFINHLSPGLTFDDVLGYSIYDFINPKHVPRVRRCYEKVMATGKSSQVEFEYIGGGESIIFDSRVNAVKHNNKIIGFIVSSRNIKRRIQVELLKNRLMTILESTTDFVGMADSQGRALYVNAAGRKMMKFANDFDITQTSIPDYYPEQVAHHFMTECIPAANQTGVWQGEVTFKATDGQEIPTMMVFIAHRSESGEVEYYSCVARDITERIVARKKLLDTKSMLETVIDTIPVRIFWKDRDSNFLGANKLVIRDAGLKSETDIIGKNDYDFFPAEHADMYRADDMHVMETGIPKLNYEEPQASPDGKTIWLQTNKAPLRNANNEIIGILGTYDDITERKRVEKIISRLAKRSMEVSTDDLFFEECLANLGEFYNTKYAFIGLISDKEKTRIKSYLVWSEGKFMDNFEYELAGTPCQDVLNGKAELIPTNVKALYPQDKMLTDMDLDSYYGTPLLLPSGEPFGLVVVTDTNPLNLESWSKPILNIYATRIAIEMGRKRSEEALRGMASSMSYQASHDPLTDLINRREFELRLETALQSSIVQNTHHALCYLDLDQFKIVNDTCGHVAGDELLRQLSLQLHHIIRESDTLARLGGDEFGVLLRDCPMDKATVIAENILKVVKEFRFVWQDKLFEIGVSIGLVPITRHTVSINEALSMADASCYLAKDHGRNRIHVYEEDDIELAKRHGEMEIVSDISQALVDNRFVLYFQTISPLCKQDTETRHFEVLLRMHDKQHNLIPPGAFIGAAERYNLMPSLDRWVISHTFKYLHNKIHNGETDNMLCAINLSGTTLSDEKFMDFLQALQEQYQLPPKMICFEFTETAAITNITRAMQFIASMKELGFLFALDDFGAGLSSYTYLKNLPVDFIKIDGSFVSGIASDPLNRSIVESINQVGHTMGIKTVAEWVDSNEVLEVLKDIEVDYAQGFHIHKPAVLE